MKLTKKMVNDNIEEFITPKYDLMKMYISEGDPVPVSVEVPQSLPGTKDHEIYYNSGPI